MVDAFPWTLGSSRGLPVTKHSYWLYVDLFRWIVQHESSDIDEPPVATLILYEVSCKLLEAHLDLSQQVPSDVVYVHDGLFQEATIG